ncbi:uncharacterized protein PAC_00243 [Phialocephala subalpina]|uniref:Glycosyl transferase n=1 Tax=Phialocephala subalpina TaxID=576137 RepID=A0A1L7WC65_9HELO|nr:uncharacterized protein PAC_00243 [Phialocephala subalpina]
MKLRIGAALAYLRISPASPGRSVHPYTRLGDHEIPWKNKSTSLRTCSSLVGLTCFAFVAGVIIALKVKSAIDSSIPNKVHFDLNSVTGPVCNNTTVEHVKEIPNIVHYVWVLGNPNQLQLSFKFFISIYSAHLYIQPDAIYIHTDASPPVFANAKQSGSTWTQRILNLPNVKYNQVPPPSQTTKGVPIERVEHKSDFLRLSALQKFGGIYLDTDAIPLRSLTPLRKTGFSTILSNQGALKMKHVGLINNGVMMSKPGSLFLEMFIQGSNEFFDGSWSGVSTDFLTDLANRLSVVPGEVLILQSNAFSPVGWELPGIEKLFKPHFSIPAKQPLFQSLTSEKAGICENLFGWLREKEIFDKESKEEWEIDFSSTYVLHAFDEGMERIRGWDHSVDLRYVMGRQSNYAMAVFPAIKHAIEKGVIEGVEGEDYV